MLGWVVVACVVGFMAYVALRPKDAFFTLLAILDYIYKSLYPQGNALHPHIRVF